MRFRTLMNRITDVVCNEIYVLLYNDTDCHSFCQLGACCFVEGTGSCSNNTEGCALYNGCKVVFDTNTTDSTVNQSDVEKKKKNSSKYLF